MARNDQLIRQLRILQLLDYSRYGMTLQELRDDLVDQLGLSGLNERTVRRDLEALQVAGMDIEIAKHQGHTVWKFGPRMKEPPEITASVTELLSLSLARDLLEPLAGTEFWQGIESLWSKFEQVLPDALLKHFRDYRQGVLVRSTPGGAYIEKKGILATLRRGIQQHRVVEMDYTTAGEAEPRSRAIEPYSLVLYQASFYLVAGIEGMPGEEGLRHYKVDRIERAACTDRYFQEREGFDAEAHLAHSIGIYRAGEPVEIRLWFSARVAAWVAEQPWPRDRQLERQPEGDLLLVLPSAYEEEILPRVMALGAEAEILAPASFRARAVDILERARRRYDEVDG